VEQLNISAKNLAGVALEDACPRCAWIRLHHKGDMPFAMSFPGIFISIDGYTKRMVRETFDSARRIPDWFPNVGKVKAMVSEDELHWRSYFRTDSKLGVTLRGQPDDIFQLADGSFHIVDYKTAKITGAQDDLFPMYEVQLNAYAFIAEKLPIAPVSALSLIYFEPQTETERGKRKGSPPGAWLEFRATRKKVQLAPKRRIPELLARAREIFDMKTAPRGAAGCKNCEQTEKFLKVAR